MSRTWGIDTHVLVRLLVMDDAEQMQAAADRLKAIDAAGQTVVITSVVAAELSWVLGGVYGFTRAAVASAIERLANTAPFVFADREAVSEALSRFASGKAGFADYLILALSEAANARPVLTFDRALAREGGCELP